MSWYAVSVSLDNRNDLTLVFRYARNSYLCTKNKINPAIPARPDATAAPIYVTELLPPTVPAKIPKRIARTMPTIKPLLC